MEIVEFEWFSGIGPKFEQARAVRRKVFVEEQGYSLIGEFDEQDADSEHIVGYLNGKPVCTARLFAEAPGVYHIGRVAVLSELRGQSYGLAMMRQITERAARMDAQKLVLNAQADKYVFYERAGFARTGKTLLDEGQPHVEMEYVPAKAN